MLTYFFQRPPSYNNVVLQHLFMESSGEKQGWQILPYIKIVCSFICPAPPWRLAYNIDGGQHQEVANAWPPLPPHTNSPWIIHPIYTKRTFSGLSMSLGIKLLLFGGGKKFGFGKIGGCMAGSQGRLTSWNFSFGTKSRSFHFSFSIGMKCNLADSDLSEIIWNPKPGWLKCFQRNQTEQIVHYKR